MAEILAALMEYYCDTYDRSRCAPGIKAAMRDAMDAGMRPSVIMLAMDASAGAERPTWAYAAAIIRRCIAEGALTPEGYRARTERHRAAAATRGKASYARGEERPAYAPGELDHLYVRLDE